MAFKQVKQGNAIDIKGEIGKSYLGKFTGHKIIQTPLGEQVIWQFKDETGKMFGIYGFGNLNAQMENVQQGALCRITYTGKSQMKNKFGKFPHRAKVEVDTDEAVDEEPPLE